MDRERVPMSIMLQVPERYKFCESCKAVNKVEAGACWRCGHENFRTMESSFADDLEEMIKIVGDHDITVYCDDPLEREDWYKNITTP